MFEYAHVWLPVILFLPFGWSLSVTDCRSHRLPNRDMIKCFFLVFFTLAVLSFSGDDFSKFLEAIKVALLCLGVFVILHLMSRGQLGMGDVKYSFILGLLVGWTNPDGWMIFIWTSFAMAALWSVGKSLRREIRLGDHIAFGPFLTVATITTCLWIAF